MRILRFALRRLAASLPTLLVILVGLFLLLQLAPGDTVDALMATMGGGDAATAAELRRFYGLDVGVPAQLARYLWRLARLDLGTSAIYGKPVATVILERLPVTLLLMTSGLALALASGVALGILAALRADRWPDALVSTLGLVFSATPSFWFGLMAIVLFAIRLGWLPPGGYETIGAGLAGSARALDVARHLLLPAVTLALIFLSTYLRVTRAAMLEVMGLDFVRTARAKGLTEGAAARRHALPNALIPVVTLAGLQAGTMLGGSVVVESVFALPGLGRLAYDAVVQRDLNTLLGIAFVSALLVILVNLATDILTAWLDPRVAAGR